MKRLLKKSPVVWKIFWLLYRWRMKRRCWCVFRHDRRMFCRFAGFSISRVKDYDLAFKLHKIEKGLILPDFRPGFGGRNVRDLIRAIRSYLAQEGRKASDFECRCALEALADYRKRHEDMGYPLEPELLEALNLILQEYPAYEGRATMTMSRAEYFQHVRADFAAFSASRHSVRELAGKAPDEDILSAAALAAHAPSACNRQPCRIHYYTEPDQIKEILSRQNGNRGFGHLAEQLVVITAELPGVLWPEERRDIALNAGIFALNFSYALHYYNVAHCLLNCSFSAEEEATLQKIAMIPPHEAIMLMIVCGKAPETVKLTASHRREWKEFFTHHGAASRC